MKVDTIENSLNQFMAS